MQDLPIPFSFRERFTYCEAEGRWEFPSKSFNNGIFTYLLTVFFFPHYHLALVKNKLSSMFNLHYSGKGSGEYWNLVLEVHASVWGGQIKNV